MNRAEEEPLQSNQSSDPTLSKPFLTHPIDNAKRVARIFQTTATRPGRPSLTANCCHQLIPKLWNSSLELIRMIPDSRPPAVQLQLKKILYPSDDLLTFSKPNSVICPIGLALGEVFATSTRVQFEISPFEIIRMIGSLVPGSKKHSNLAMLVNAMVETGSVFIPFVYASPVNGPDNVFSQ